MSGRGVKLTDEQKLIYGQLAYDKKVEGWPNTEIAELVGVHRNTIPGLLEHEERIRIREARSSAKGLAKARYEKILRLILEDVAKPQTNGLAKPALYNAAINAQTRIDKIEANEAPTRSNITQRVEYVDYSALSDEQLEKAASLEEQWRAVLSDAIKGEG